MADTADADVVRKSLLEVPIGVENVTCHACTSDGTTKMMSAFVDPCPASTMIRQLRTGDISHFTCEAEHEELELQTVSESLSHVVLLQPSYST